MTVMYSFCLWFPVRLGAFIVGLTCVGESLSCLIATLIGLNDPEGTAEQIEKWLSKSDLIVATGFFVAMRDDPVSFLNAFVAILSIHIITCIMLLVGAYRCTLWLIYPFVGIDFLRLLTLSGILIVILLIIKANTITLGMVIACSIFGGFILLYFWYQWFCVVSLCQIIQEIRRLDQIVPITYPAAVSQKFGVPFYPTPLNDNFGLRSDNKQYFGLPPLT